MTENERVKVLRKELNLTQEEFGERIGVKKTSISNIESGQRNLTDHMFNSICRDFHVSPEWLRDGTGEMFPALSRNESIAFFVEELMQEADNSFKLRLIDVLARLDEDEWKMLADLAKRLAAEE